MFKNSSKLIAMHTITNTGNRIPKEQHFIHVYKFSSKIVFTITYGIYLIIDSIIFNLYLTTSIKFIYKSLA